MIFRIGCIAYYYDDPQLEEIYKQFPETRKSFLTWHQKLGSVTRYVDIKTGKIYHVFPYPSSYFLEEKIIGVEKLQAIIDVTKYNKDLIQLYQMLKTEKATNLLSKAINNSIIIICMCFAACITLKPFLLEDVYYRPVPYPVLHHIIFWLGLTAIIGFAFNLITTLILRKVQKQ